MSQKTISFSQGHEFLKALERAGLTPQLIQNVIEAAGNRLARRLVSVTSSRFLWGTSQHDEARQIMGYRFINPLEVIWFLGQFFNIDLQGSWYWIPPFSAKTLEKCQNTHWLIPGFPLSVNDQRRVFIETEAPLWYDQGKPFAQELVEPRWYLIRHLLPGSNDETYENQLAMITADEEVPKACEIFYLYALIDLIRGEYLYLPSRYVRCRDLAKEGGSSRVAFGYHEAPVLEPHIVSFEDSEKRPDLGIATSWKPMN